MTDQSLPATATGEAVLHGLDLSYFTGKVQAYLRYAEIPHRFAEMDTAALRRAAQMTGMAQMPAIELADGRWMTDSTAIIGWFDASGATTVPVTPTDPATAFLAALIEDHADEWLWRPALHYRWSYPMDAWHMGRRIAAEMLRDVPGPLWLRQWGIIARQRHRYLARDGVTPATRAHVESLYLRNLDWPEAILSRRPFLLGERPSLADFGYFASMFRHFGLDPTPSRILRDRAPSVFLWLARMWAARASRLSGPAPDQVPGDLDPILRDIGGAYLPYLADNARAHAAGLSTFDTVTEGVTYHLPPHPYRVWCLDQLQRRFEALPEAAAATVRARLEATGAWDPLWAVRHPRSGFDPLDRLPFLTPGTAWAER